MGLGWAGPCVQGVGWAGAGAVVAPTHAGSQEPIVKFQEFCKPDVKHCHYFTPSDGVNLTMK